jgi:hypothetical protein
MRRQLLAVLAMVSLVVMFAAEAWAHPRAFVEVRTWDGFGYYVTTKMIPAHPGPYPPGVRVIREYGSWVPYANPLGETYLVWEGPLPPGWIWVVESQRWRRHGHYIGCANPPPFSPAHRRFVSRRGPSPHHSRH